MTLGLLENFCVTVSSLKLSAESRGKLLELVFHGVFFPIAYFFSPNCSINESQMNLRTNPASISQTHRLCLHKHPCSHPSSHKLTANTQRSNHVATSSHEAFSCRRRCHLFPIHHNIAQPFIFIYL